jgi:hypothetical protein
MSKYVKVTRPDCGKTNYAQPVREIRNILDGEFDGFEEWAEVGDIIQFEVIEMDDEEYSKLKEFEGW